MKAETRKHTIMVVDDDPMNIVILEHGLSDTYDIISTTTSDDVLRLARLYSPDIILLDVILPDVDGLDLCKQLKSELSTKDIPVIFITSADAVQDEIAGLKVGAVDYLHKPFSIPLIKVRIALQIQLMEQRKELEYLAWKDGLTGIPNRRSFDVKFNEACKHAERTKRNVCIMMLDIDFFKQYNDTYGHLEGDRVLRMVAQSIQDNATRPYDLVARYGGEEFVVLLSEVNPSSAPIIAERIRQGIEDLAIPHKASSISDILTLCIGVATSHDNGHMLCQQDFLNVADACLYEAKQTGRNKVCYGEYRAKDV